MPWADAYGSEIAVGVFLLTGFPYGGNSVAEQRSIELYSEAGSAGFRRVVGYGFVAELCQLVQPLLELFRGGRLGPQQQGFGRFCKVTDARQFALAGGLFVFISEAVFGVIVKVGQPFAGEGVGFRHEIERYDDGRFEGYGVGRRHSDVTSVGRVYGVGWADL